MACFPWTRWWVLPPTLIEWKADLVLGRRRLDWREAHQKGFEGPSRPPAPAVKRTRVGNVETETGGRLALEF
jgi:hypothetical protein